MEGEQAEFLALVTKYPEGFLGKVEALEKLTKIEPERFVVWALATDTNDPERPGQVADWLLPGWAFDVDYQYDGDGPPYIVTTCLSPKRRN